MFPQEYGLAILKLLYNILGLNKQVSIFYIINSRFLSVREESYRQTQRRGYT